MKRGLLRTGKECLKENSHLMTCIVYSLLWLDHLCKYTWPMNGIFILTRESISLVELKFVGFIKCLFSYFGGRMSKHCNQASRAKVAALPP